jgi:RsiW-degrading membrane proteinase PrsW (M82 family)
MANLPPARKPRDLGRSTWMPLLGDRSGLASKIHLLPVLATIVAGLLLPMAGNLPFVPHAMGVFAPYAEYNQAIQVCWILGALITFLVTYYIYMLCGRDKPWWLLVIVFAVMALVMSGGPLLHIVASYNNWAFQDDDGRMAKILGAYYGPGLAEELVKALPVFFLVWFGQRKSQLAQRIGVHEPLDGILIAVVSAAGFALVEDGTYVHNAMWMVTVVEHCPRPFTEECVKQAVEGEYGVATYTALGLLLSRALPSLAGHMAYSGVFGYFIGLSVIIPAFKWRILLTGWLSAMALHGSWDAVPEVTQDDELVRVLLFAVAAVSYVFLGAAILKARKLSPTRAFNFATQMGDPVAAAASNRAPLAPAPTPAVAPPPPPAPAAATDAKPEPVPVAALVLKIGTVTRAVAAGVTIEPMHLGMAGAGRGNGAIAEIVSNPKEPSLLGLKNLSDRIYRATMPDRQTFDIARGETARLAPGVVIDFGGISGTVQPA